MIKTKYMFSEAKAKDTTSEAKAKDLAFKAKDLAPKAKAKDMTSCPRGASRPRPWPRGLHLCHPCMVPEDTSAFTDDVLCKLIVYLFTYIPEQVSK